MAVRSPPSVFKEMRPMDATMIDEHLENIDRRLTTLEQILPTLATKEELHATEGKLRDEIRDAAEQSRRHMTMLIEHQDTKLQLIAEHVVSLMDKRR
jgi:hypothetical protein